MQIEDYIVNSPYLVAVLLTLYVLEIAAYQLLVLLCFLMCLLKVSCQTTVDTGAQSTIISCSTLHAVGCHLTQNGCPLPTLEKPTVRLYGKDGPDGGQQLTITAQLELSLWMVSP